MRRGEVEELLRFWQERQAKMDAQDIFRWKQILVGRELDSVATAARPKKRRAKQRQEKKWKSICSTKNMNLQI